MNRLYIVTGAAGHLGNTIIRMLKERKVAVRGLILPSETVTPGENVTYFQGDVRDGASMEPLFAGCEEQETTQRESWISLAQYRPRFIT